MDIFSCLTLFYFNNVTAWEDITVLLKEIKLKHNGHAHQQQH